MNSKPSTCRGCPLDAKGTGYALPVGPVNAPILLVGEALGREEASRGEPFVGAAGAFLTRSLGQLGVKREEVRIHNVVSCQPPNDWLAGSPWEYEAINHCAVHRTPVLSEAHQVIVTLGVTPTREVLRAFGRDYSGRLEDWRGRVIGDGSHPWIVPSFHPAFILRGNARYTGVFLHDLKVAVDASRGFSRSQVDLVVDPDPDWFAGWAAGLGDGSWLSVDIETGDCSDEDFQKSLAPIVRINFSYNTEQGITVPWEARYLETIKELLTATCPKSFWYGRYDLPVLRNHGIAVAGPIYDWMWGWHHLQSDMGELEDEHSGTSKGSAVKGNGLGFVAAFYSDMEPWKHLSDTQPGKYAAIDAVQTTRCAFGIARDLQSQGMWDAFLQHTVALDARVLNPAEHKGILIDKDHLGGFRESLVSREEEIAKILTKQVPEAVLSLHPPAGWKKEPTLPKTVTFKRGEEKVEVEYTDPRELVKREVEEINKAGEFVKEDRWYVREPFNPASPQQILAYMNYHKHTAGRNKYTGKSSSDENALTALAKKHPFYQLLLDFRKVQKVRGTYVDGTLSRMDSSNHVHPKFLHRPSTMRLSCVDPNLQNVVKEDGEFTIANGFRKAVIAPPGCVIVESDYSAIEAVLTGWYSRDPKVLRLARLGIHGGVVGLFKGVHFDMDWSDADLAALFGDLKKKYPEDYDRAKRVVYGRFYGLSIAGMVNTYPQLFTRASAGALSGVLDALCPSIPAFQADVRKRAARQNYLGGADHPYHYKHWFWEVVTWSKARGGWIPGADSNRVVAYYPQSTAAGVIKDAALRLVNPEDPAYVGSLGPDGETPIRGLIHDSILSYVRTEKLDEYLEKVNLAMRSPIKVLPTDWATGVKGDCLTIGTVDKAGEDWMSMEKVG